MFIFDGDAKRIYIDDYIPGSGPVTFTPQELWSRYVDWRSQGDNSKYLPAMRTVDAIISGGQLLGPYVFMRNDLGWRGVPPSVNGIIININGSLYGEDPTLPIMENIPNQETDLIINMSSLTNTVNTGGGSIPYTLAQIADAVWSKVLP